MSALGVGIRQYVYALNPVCIVLIIRHPYREVPRQGCGHEVNPGIQMTIHRTWHTLINTSIWNFNSLFRVCLIFLHIRFYKLQKASGITPWKMLLATALALLITGCAQQTFTVQNKPAAVAPKETITHHFFVSWNWAEEKTVDAANSEKAEMLLKQKPSKHS